MTLVKLELRVRDWYVPHPLFMSLQIGYLKLLKKFLRVKEKYLLLSTINPIMTLVKLELRVRDWYVPHPLFMSLQIGYLKLLKKFLRVKEKCL
jgi:hypothetical protein